MLKRIMSPPYTERYGHDAQTLACDGKQMQHSIIGKANASSKYAVSHRNSMNTNTVSARVKDYAGALPLYFPQTNGGARI